MYTHKTKVFSIFILSIHRKPLFSYWVSTESLHFHTECAQKSSIFILSIYAENIHFCTFRIKWKVHIHLKIFHTVLSICKHSFCLHLVWKWRFPAYNQYKNGGFLRTQYTYDYIYSLLGKNSKSLRWKLSCQCTFKIRYLGAIIVINGQIHYSIFLYPWAIYVPCLTATGGYQIGQVILRNIRDIINNEICFCSTSYFFYDII